MKRYQIVLIALAVLLGIIWTVGRYTNGIQHYTASSRSNEPTFKVGKHIFGSNLKTPKRMDFISYYNITPAFEGQIWIHRLCGLPGDTVEFKNGDLYVNGVNQDASLNLKKRYCIPAALVADLQFEEGDVMPRGADSLSVPLETIAQKELIAKARVELDETVDPHIKEQYGQPWGTSHFGPYVVPANTYFVVGDNRYFSMDSRYSGPVPIKEYLTTILK